MLFSGSIQLNSLTSNASTCNQKFTYWLSIQSPRMWSWIFKLNTSSQKQVHAKEMSQSWIVFALFLSYSMWLWQSLYVYNTLAKSEWYYLQISFLLYSSIIVMFCKGYQIKHIETNPKDQLCHSNTFKSRKKLKKTVDSGFEKKWNQSSEPVYRSGLFIRSSERFYQCQRDFIEGTLSSYYSWLLMTGYSSYSKIRKNCGPTYTLFYVSICLDT